MKYFIFTLFLSFSFHLFSQNTWQIEYQLMESYNNESQNTLALKHGANALKIAETEYSKTSIEYGLTLQYLGIVYYENNNNSKAIECFNSSKQIFNKSKGESKNEAVSSYLLGSLYLSEKQYEKSKTELFYAGELFEEFVGINDAYYAAVLEDLAQLFIEIGENKNALDIYLSLVDVYRFDVNSNYLELANVYSELSILYQENKKYNRSESFAYKTFDILDKYNETHSEVYYKVYALQGINYIFQGKSQLGESMIIASKTYYSKNNLQSDFLYHKMLIGLGISNYQMEYYGEAHKYLTMTIEMFPNQKKWRGIDHLKALEVISNTLLQTGNYDDAKTYISNLESENAKYKSYSITEINNLKGILAYKKGNLSEAEKIFFKNLPTNFDTLSHKELEYVTNYANVLSDLGQYDKAEEHYLNVLEIIERKTPFNLNNYISNLNNLALLYLEKGDYSRTEVIMNDCVNMSRKSFGAKSNEYALALNNLGAMYFEIGNYDLAVNYFIEASKLYETNFGEESIEYTSLQSNIALLFSTIGEHEEAIEILNNVKDIEEKILGTNNINHAQNLLNLSSEYFEINNLIQAEKTINENIKILLEVVGNKHPNLVGSYILKGNIKAKQNKLEGALKYFQDASSLSISSYGNKSKEYAKSLIATAEIQNKLKQYDEAYTNYMIAKVILNENLDDVFAFLSEQEKEKYLQTLNNDFNSFFDFGISNSTLKPELGGTIFNQSLKLKGLLLKSSSIMKNTIYNGNDDELKDLYTKWASVKKRLSELYATQNDLKSQKINELEEEANNLEKTLYQRISLDKNIKKDLNEDWKIIQSKLNPQDVILEFISYKNESNKTKYAVLILNDTLKYPKIIQLFEEEEIKNIIGAYGANNYEYVKNVYGDNQNHKNELYNLIWAPIKNELNNKKNLYISPTGILHRISLWALGENPEQLMIDLYNLRSLSTASNIIDKKHIYKADLTNITLYGDIKYNTPNTEEEHWKYLAGTKEEVKGLEKSFKSKNFNTTVITGLDATESAFKEKSSTSNLIHVATHGFFFPDPEHLIAQAEVEEVEDVGFRGSSSVVGLSSFTNNKNPLMRSGLIFAGVNDLWNKEKFGKKDDGVLTAYEVTQMDFSKTKLIVLSACETGLGEISGNEGVYGLQRALKMHGIPYIINSLWQVPDKETQEFMNHFYEELLSKNLEVSEAFDNARNIMRKKYAPYYWGAFTLIE